MSNKIPTDAQWQDLADKVNAKAETSALPTAVSDLTNDADYQTGSDVSSAISTATQNMPVITMTNVDPGEGSALAEDHYVAVYGGDPIILDYSTSEVNTGVKWIDGSTIYKKTVDTGALPNITTKTVAHDISNLGTVVDFYGVAYNPNTKLRIKTDYPYTEYAVRTSVNDTYINISTAADQSSFTQSYVTVYYTKSSS